MQFFCDQCKTKYSISDDKIAGKILKLRCKRCNNTIVLKDPRTGVSTEKGESPSRGQQLLKDAFKKSFQEELSSSHEVFPVASDMPEERTQIARIPVFEDSHASEEWYLSDSRGQFGPMDFGEMVARIKRGEPDHDAVVWRDGFDDWKTIDRVPELRLYHKHLPPPRRATRELFREPPSFSQNAQGSGVFSPQGMGNPFPSAPVQASQSFRSPTMDYGSMSTPMMMGQASMDVPRTMVVPGSPVKYWVIGGVLVILVGFAAFYLGGKLMADKKDAPAPLPPVVAVQPEAVKESQTVEGEEPMREVVYVIAAQPTETEEETRSGSGGMRTSGPSGPRAPGSSGTPDMATDAVMGSGAGARSSADFNNVKNRNIMEVTRCYEMTVRKGQKELVGQSIRFQIRILASGQVESVSFTGEMPPMMRACLDNTIKKWQFPEGARTDSFNFEMHFN